MGSKIGKVRIDLESSLVLLIALLFGYTGLKKVINYGVFYQSLLDSPLIPNEFVFVVFLLIPVLEFIVVFYLLAERKKIIGLYLSLVLLTVFTIYLLLLINLFEFIPCGCGGFIEKLTTKEHIVFNGAFLLLNIILILKVRK